MNAFFYALMSLAIAATNVSAIGETMTCTTYSASPKGFACNDRPDIVCTEGCKTFVTSSQCKFDKYPKKPTTSELCTVGFGSTSATTKSNLFLPHFAVCLCITGQGSFSCTGKSTGSAKCYGCVAYNKIPWAS
ncbi:hypothetical protein VP01_2734g2 [Puccinia sorghi]|uniref:Uncharacterized protein n=1 Tax=Puccinia sorghi TaxID=27349 RepID=A0A0L6V370_9BASI|nr:hypothetical protein VP01_2734g2 [Puccinia sorghi]